MKKLGIVYKITNNITGMCYIGGTMGDLLKRWSVHKTSARKKRKTKLHTDMWLFGIENFSLDEIEVCENEIKLAEREDYYIRLNNSIWPNGYNSYLRTPRYFNFNGGDGVADDILNWLSINGIKRSWLSLKTGISISKMTCLLRYRTSALRQEDLAKINKVLGTNFKQD